MEHRVARRLAVLITLASPASAQQPFAFTHVTVIDAADSTPRGDQ
jgi:hypothetical protein